MYKSDLNYGNDHNVMMYKMTHKRIVRVMQSAVVEQAGFVDFLDKIKKEIYRDCDLTRDQTIHNLATSYTSCIFSCIRRMRKITSGMMDVDLDFLSDPYNTNRILAALLYKRFNDKNFFNNLDFLFMEVHPFVGDEVLDKKLTMVQMCGKDKNVKPEIMFSVTESRNVLFPYNQKPFKFHAAYNGGYAYFYDDDNGYYFKGNPPQYSNIIISRLGEELRSESVKTSNVVAWDYA